MAACALARLARWFCACRPPRAVRLRLWLAPDRWARTALGRPARVARRSQCAGQLARWRLEVETSQPADVRRWGGAPTGYAARPSRRARARTAKISVIRQSAVLAVDEFARGAAIVASPLHDPQTVRQAASSPARRHRATAGNRGAAKKFSSTMALLAMPNCREAGGFGRSHSLSFDHRLRPDTLRTAMATAFFCPTSTTSFLPRVTPV